MMTRFLDQQPEAGRMSFTLDGRVPTEESREKIIRMALGRIYIPQGITLAEELIPWLRTLETIGWDIYARREHFQAIGPHPVTGKLWDER